MRGVSPGLVRIVGWSVALAFLAATASLPGLSSAREASAAAPTIREAVLVSPNLGYGLDDVCVATDEGAIACGRPLLAPANYRSTAIPVFQAQTSSGASAVAKAATAAPVKARKLPRRRILRRRDAPAPQLVKARARTAERG